MCNGLVAPDRVWNPHAYEVQRVYQNIKFRLTDVKKWKAGGKEWLFFQITC
jgi:beta-galactosidase